MNRGIVQFTPSTLLHHAFPDSWDITNITFKDGLIEALVEGPEFPFVPFGNIIPTCIVTIRQKIVSEYIITIKEKQDGR